MAGYTMNVNSSRNSCDMFEVRSCFDKTTVLSFAVCLMAKKSWSEGQRRAHMICQLGLGVYGHKVVVLVDDVFTNGGSFLLLVRHSV